MTGSELLWIRGSFFTDLAFCSVDLLMRDLKTSDSRDCSRFPNRQTQSLLHAYAYESIQFWFFDQ